MAAPTVYVIGAGLAGLSAAVALAKGGHRVVVHELARHAGGRCRTYFEPALQLHIDNGNHLLLSGNTAARAFLATIGAEAALPDPGSAEFPFADTASGARWVLRPNAGRLPWWIASKSRRVPGTRAADYVALARLLAVRGTATMPEVIPCHGALYDKLLRPVFLAALNTDPREASAKLAGALVRETFAVGGRACHPLIAQRGLGPAFIDPALAFLARHGAEVRFDRQLTRIDRDSASVRALEFGEDRIALAGGDAAILAVPAWVAPLLLPEISAPRTFRAIINAHFKIAPPAKLPPILGVINGTTEWIFAFPDRISVTISAGDRFIEAEREPLARDIWREIAALTGLGAELPPWQIVKERRATFAALPAEDARRPDTETRWPNLFLAGDWTATGLPATIEGAIRSGNRAADLVARRRF